MYLRRSLSGVGCALPSKSVYCPSHALAADWTFQSCCLCVCLVGPWQTTQRGETTYHPSSTCAPISTQQEDRHNGSTSDPSLAVTYTITLAAMSCLHIATELDVTWGQT